MTLSRRTAILSASAALAACTTKAAKPRPLVIAHRGASGERPEHTLAAYRLAIAQGADFIEPDLVMTKDGALVARHENEIGETTDAGARPEFAARKTTKIVDGAPITGWFAEDFTLAELKTLRARERLPALRPASAAFDGREPIVTFQEVIDLAKAESARTGRVIGLYPEMKHPSFLASVGLDIQGALAAALRANNLDSKDAPIFVQCFEPRPLREFRAKSKARLVQLVSAGTPEERLLTPEGLKEIASYADGVGPSYSLVIPQGETLGAATPLVADAHAAGLAIHPWTVRAENRFLPKSLQSSADPAAHGDVGALLAALYASGVDGLFSDFPGLAVQARDKAFG